MSSYKPSPAPSLATVLLARLAVCREQLRDAAEQFRESRDDEDASRIAQETIDFPSSGAGSKAFKSRPIGPLLT
jgi:hypothetical protein